MQFRVVVYFEDRCRFCELQDACRTAFITTLTRNGRRRTIRATYSPARRASSPNQSYSVTRPAPNRNRPRPVNAALYATVRNAFFVFHPLARADVAAAAAAANYPRQSHKYFSRSPPSPPSPPALPQCIPPRN